MIIEYAVIAFLAIVAIGVFLLSGVVRYIPNNAVGVVEKVFGSKSLKGGLIALNGEVGYQPDILRGGFHFFSPFQYSVHKTDLVTIPQGQIGYVFSRDGKTLNAGQALANNEKACNFEDARDFLVQGGQRGPQRKILREGTYAINLGLFAVITKQQVYSLSLRDEEEQTIKAMGNQIADRQGFEPIIIGASNRGRGRVEDDQVGIVTVHDGRSLDVGEIIAPAVGQDPGNATTFHNDFQNIEAFLHAGGRRGRQYQVLVDGTYYINRLFATVEFIDKTVIEIGHVGVVVSYTGKKGDDLSGDSYSHGELVTSGCRGVWQDPLQPGKYPFNTYAGQIIQVPTTNFILKWSKEVTNEHKFDENLTEVSLITKDAFEPSLPLSVVVHIDYRKAPLVVQRFGDIKRLVDQTLDPMVSAYFKNVGQTKTLIELLQERSEIQQTAGKEMRGKFAEYNLELQEVLIGTPHSGAGPSASAIDTILDQLRQRQVAREKNETFAVQEVTAQRERSLNDANAIAENQGNLTKSNIQIRISENEGAAALARAEKDAKITEVTAEAAKRRATLEGEGEAAKVAAIGEAEGKAIRAKVEAYQGEGAQLQVTQAILTRLAEAIGEKGIALVPQIQVGAGEGAQGNSGNGNIASMLSALLANQLNGLPGASHGTPAGVVAPASADSAGQPQS